MVSAVITIHILVCISLVIVVLLQQGKGADIGAVFGGSSQTVFGSSGAGNLLTRVTSALAAIFFLTSMFLAYASARHVSGSIFDRSIPMSSTSEPGRPGSSAPHAAAPASAPKAPIAGGAKSSGPKSAR